MTARVKDMVEEWVGTMNDATHMGQYHRTTFLIMVICCLALLIVFMLSHQASCRRGRSDRCIHKGVGSFSQNSGASCTIHRAENQIGVRRLNLPPEKNNKWLVS